MSIFHMTDIIPLLGLPEPTPSRRSYYIPCPCCDNGRQKHLNINLEKDVFRCPRCGFKGGVFDFYAYYTNIPREAVYDELKLKIGDFDIARIRPRASRPPVAIKESAAADVQVRDSAYRALLGMLELASDHRENLLRRGLTADVIIQKGYRTTPLIGTKTMAKQLSSDGCTLAGVPGFYRCADGQWSFVSEQRGILIPVRDVQGQIQGLQIRRDNAVKRKFRWVSSTGRQDGCRSEGWTHFAGSVREQILLIEGPMKADIIHHLTGLPVLAVPGVNALLQLEQALSELKQHGVRRIMTAFDMDFLRNFYVQNGYAELTGLLDKMGFSFGTYLWNPDYNGLDDYVWQCCTQKSTHGN